MNSLIEVWQRIIQWGDNMTTILKDIFGNTKRINILEKLIDNWGELLTIDEISRMADTSPKTAYFHINELKNIGILDYIDEKPKKFRLKEDDKRALALAILESEEYLRKSEKLLQKMETEEEIIKSYKKYLDYYNFDYSSSIDENLKLNYKNIEAEAK